MNAWAKLAIPATVIASLAIACATPAKKETLVVCQDEDKGCDEGDGDDDEGSRKREKGPSTETNPTAQEPVKEEKKGDAGSEASAPPLGFECTALKDCCAALRSAGITGSANQCDGVVEDANELSCQLAHTDYKTPDENYDPVCE